MTRTRTIVVIAVLALAVAGAWVLFVALPRRYGPPPAAPTPAAAAPAAAVESAPARKITATLYYVADDGLSLVGTQREVAYGSRIAEQARAIVDAEIGPAPPLLSAIPAGTKLLNLFVTDRGDAFVDLSGDVRAKHTGGSLDELLTVYSIVDALTVNLPAIARVQVLVDGKEVETLAGHVDLRHPLVKNLEWIAHDTH